MPPVRKLCPESRQLGRIPAVQLGMKTFLDFILEFRGKIISYFPNIVRAPPPPVTLLWRRARLKINQSCMSITRRQKIYLKTPRINILKARKNGMLTIVNICSD